MFNSYLFGVVSFPFKNIQVQQRKKKFKILFYAVVFNRTEKTKSKVDRDSKSTVSRQKRGILKNVKKKVWNEMPNEYKNLSKKSIKKETKRALLNILETEDSYMEPDEIMLKFKHSKIESN